MSPRKSEEIESKSFLKASRNLTGIQRRNERERHRIMQVNRAFDDLRKRVPSNNGQRKISKVETLRSAIEYIKALDDIVNQQNENKLLHSDTKFGEMQSGENTFECSSKNPLNCTLPESNFTEDFHKYGFELNYHRQQETSSISTQQNLCTSELSWLNVNEGSLFGEADVLL